MSDESELAKLRKNRSIRRGLVTKTENQIRTLLQNFSIDNEDQEAKLEGLRNQYDSRLQAVKNLDQSILNLTEQEDYEAELIDTEEYYDLSFEIFAKVGQKLNRNRVTTTTPPTTLSPNHDTSITSNSSTTPKLPRLEIKKFDGKIINWQTFWDQYESSIDSKDNLSDIDKFGYLKTLLCDSARETISGLLLTSENYREAIKLLKDRFANPQVQVSAYMDQLYKLKRIESMSNVHELRKLYDKVESSIRNLNSLGIPSETYGAFLVPLLTDKLPTSLRLCIARKMTSEIWNLNQMMDYFKIELVAHERCSTVSIESDKRDFENENDFTCAYSNFSKSVNLCVFCNQRHPSYKCRKVTDISQRKSILRKSGRCFLCLERGHLMRNCISKYQCNKCKGKHNITICEGSRKFDSNQKGDADSKGDFNLTPAIPETLATLNENKNSTLLQTAYSKVFSEDLSISSSTHMMFDSGSQKSYVTNELKKKLKLKPIRNEKIIVKTFGSTEGKVTFVDVVNLKIKCRNNVFVTIEALCVPIICSPILGQKPIEISKSYTEFSNLYLADFEINTEKKTIKILIGLDYYYSFVKGNIIRSTKDDLVALESKLGWIICGTHETDITSSNIHTYRVDCLSKETESLRTTFNKFLKTDSSEFSETESDCVKTFKENLKFNGDRYEVKLPFRPHTDFVPDNYIVAEKRLTTLRGQLEKDLNLLSEYDKVINNYLEMGIIEKVSLIENVEPGKIHYLPHRAVVKPDRETTKVRVVFDASSKQFSEPSLNDLLYTGPCLLPKLYEILLRFRCGKIALVADIKQAFLQIEVNQSHRDFLRFLWYDSITTDNPNIVAFRFTRILFGLNSSPFILEATLQMHMSKYDFIFNDIDLVQKFIRDLYMDDTTNSFNDIDTTIMFYNKIRTYLSEGGFELRKWETNDNALRDFLYQNEKTKQSCKPLENFGRKDFRKVLGLNWNSEYDEILFDFKNIVDQANNLNCTKRNVLKVGASFFDPLGLISPVTLQAKLIFKCICEKKLNWDDELPEPLFKKWKDFVYSLKSLAFTIPRCVFFSENVISFIELHGFADSSNQAYAAVVYVRIVTDKDIKVSFLTSKTRVAPNKPLTIPRLELLSCLLLTNLMKTIVESIKHEITIARSICWTDSKIAYYWITQKYKDWKPWVQNRVNRINEFATEWQHVPGSVNPADIATREINLLHTSIKNEWFNGPQFLCNTEGDWPSEEQIVPILSDLEIKKETIQFATEVEYKEHIISLIDIEKYSSLTKLFNITAFVLRFVFNLKNYAKNKQNLLKEHLKTEEIKQAEYTWIKTLQEKHSVNENFNKIKSSLKLFVDEHGVLRCKSRLSESEHLSFNHCNPIYIPNEEHFIKLIVLKAHNQVCHNGIESTLNHLRTKYWIVKGRQKVKTILKNCVLCRLCQAKPCLPPVSPPLPNFRVSFNHPFEVTGIDYAGPLFIRDTNSKEMKKCYILLLTCASTRCTHLELVNDYRWQSLLLALKRFISRRGTSKLFISDNFTTFKSKEITDFLRVYDISWEFILQKSPWWGGFYEKLVGITKMLLKKVVGRAKLTYDELVTAIYEVENSINSRPLTYLTEENYQTALTPHHLLYGRNINERNDTLNAIETDHDSAIVRVKHLQTILEHFRKRFYLEYLISLREKHSYVKSKTSDQCFIKEGDVVLIKENDFTPRLSWKKGIIEKLIIGKDNNVRGASVRTTYGKSMKTVVLNRPLQLLIPLELSTSENIEKRQVEPVQSVIKNYNDISSNEPNESNNANLQSKRLAAQNANIINKLLSEK